MTANGTIALITGANRGLGLETARQLGERGVTVLLGARDAEQGRLAAAQLREQGTDAFELRLDVTDAESIAAAAAEVERRWQRLDVLINNAGVAPEMMQPASQAPLSDWHRTFETNLFGLVAVTQAFLPLLRRSGAGRIVNLSSNLGSLGAASDPESPIAMVVGHGAAYGASKSALNMFTVHLARELAGTGIKVNSAHPGWVKTDMGGEQAPMELVDGARTSVQLALLPADGPTGGFFHLGERLPW